MNYYFTSDTHFGHANIIKYCNRPFLNQYEMNRKMIELWNAKVPPGSVVWHCGDFALGLLSDAIDVRNALNGEIHLVWGNHDQNAQKMKEMWESTQYYKELKIPGYPMIVLSHYAFRVWNRSHHGSWHLYGHSHGTLPDDPNSCSFDVGVDCHNLQPLHIDEVKAIMATKNFVPVDHHNQETH